MASAPPRALEHMLEGDDEDPPTLVLGILDRASLPPIPVPEQLSSPQVLRRPRGLEGMLEGSGRGFQNIEEDAPLTATPTAKSRMLIASATLLTLCALPYVVPGLGRFEPWKPEEGYVPFWNIVGRELLGQGAVAEQENAELRRLEGLAKRALSAEPTVAGTPARPPAPASVPSAALARPAEDRAPVFPAYIPHSDDDEPPGAIIQGVAALDYFYQRLTLTDLEHAANITRAGHWGDSVLGGDGVTATIRQRLQARFGDGGHGFHALGRYNLAYSHRGVQYSDKGGWHSCQIIFKCQSDGHYGYAGVSTKSSAGGTSVFATVDEGFGSQVSHFELWYAKQPRGGSFQIKVDEQVARIVDTAAESLTDGWETLEVPDASHRFEVRAIGPGLARGYGVVLERPGPGVVWDELSLIGSFTQRLDYQNPQHIAAQIKRRDLDLLVFMFGGNDVQREDSDLYRSTKVYEEEYARVVAKFKAGKPEASCLIVSLVDHGELTDNGAVRSRKIMASLVAAQFRVAQQQGCGFFDTVAAMGGENAVARWRSARPRLMGPDLSHPTLAGQELLGTFLYEALVHGYALYRQAHTGKPLSTQ